MSSTNTLIVVGVIAALAIIGYLFITPSDLVVPGTNSPREENTSTDFGTPNDSIDDFESALDADLSAEAQSASDSGDVDAALSADQDSITSLTNNSDDSSY